jgi:cytochrome P450
LLLAGNVTTSDLIGNTVMALLRHPEELKKLRARPELLENAIDEVLRYDTPVTDTGRIANRDIEIAGVKIEQGDSMTASLAGANHDPEIYPEPDRFDIERKDTHHQSFGGGRHFCLGSHLARIEAQETLAALLTRFSRLSLIEDGFEYAANASLRGLKSLHVRAEH